MMRDTRSLMAVQSNPGLMSAAPPRYGFDDAILVLVIILVLVLGRPIVVASIDLVSVNDALSLDTSLTPGQRPKP